MPVSFSTTADVNIAFCKCDHGTFLPKYDLLDDSESDDDVSCKASNHKCTTNNVT